MIRLIEDFSIEVQVTDPNITEQYTEKVDLKVEEWTPGTFTAYTFNGDTQNTAKQLYKALEKYKKLRFTTGVMGHAENSQIQQSMRSHMSRLYGEKIHQEVTGGLYKDTGIELATINN